MIENDVVKLLVPVGDWPADTVGTAVSLYAGGALVEVSDEETGKHAYCGTTSPSGCFLALTPSELVRLAR
jgi:hypothetical protein